ncbi:MAG: hypothetical protein V4493_01190 [Pseudomonadota bacterium]
MSVNYSATVKTARMQAVADAIGASGKLQIGTSSVASILAGITLGSPSGTVSGSVLTLSGFPLSDTSADNSGKAINARIRTSADADVITGLTVGLTSTAAPAWTGSTAYTVGSYKTNGANQYKCVTAGMSASSGGPTGTGTAITDGSAVWDYYSPASADVQLDSLEITATQTVTVNSATFTHA